jgi:hypothetical protein
MSATNDKVLKALDTAQKALEEARKGYLALLAAAQEEEQQEEAQEEEGSAGRVLYWGEDEEPTDLDAMNLKELTAFAKSAEIVLTAAAKKDADTARNEIYYAYNPIEEAAEEEEEEAQPEEEEAEPVSTVVTVLDADENEMEIDLAEYDEDQLREFADTYGVELSSDDAETMIQEIIDALYSSVEDGSDEESTDPEDIYGLRDMTEEELCNILASNGLSPKGKRQALVDRIVKGIEEGKIATGE